MDAPHFFYSVTLILLHVLWCANLLTACGNLLVDSTLYGCSTTCREDAAFSSSEVENVYHSTTIEELRVGFCSCSTEQVIILIVIEFRGIITLIKPTETKALITTSQISLIVNEKSLIISAWRYIEK